MKKRIRKTTILLVIMAMLLSISVCLMANSCDDPNANTFTQDDFVVDEYGLSAKCESKELKSNVTYTYDLPLLSNRAGDYEFVVTDEKCTSKETGATIRVDLQVKYSHYVEDNPGYTFVSTIGGDDKYESISGEKQGKQLISQSALIKRTGDSSDYTFPEVRLLVTVSKSTEISVMWGLKNKENSTIKYIDGIEDGKTKSTNYLWIPATDAANQMNLLNPLYKLFLTPKSAKILGKSLKNLSTSERLKKLSLETSTTSSVLKDNLTKAIEENFPTTLTELIKTLNNKKFSWKDAMLKALMSFTTNSVLDLATLKLQIDGAVKALTNATTSMELSVYIDGGFDEGCAPCYFYVEKIGNELGTSTIFGDQIVPVSYKQALYGVPGYDGLFLSFKTTI